MDNAEGTSGVAPSQGQAQPQTQPAPGDAQSSAVVGAGQNQESPAKGQTGEGEGLILGKFKTTEDVVKAYQELESHNKKVEMDKAELEKLFVPAEPESPPKAAEVETTDPLDDVVKALMPRMTSAMEAVVSRPLAQMEIDRVVRKYGDDFVAVAPAVAELRKQNPSLTLEAAYKIVAFDNRERTARQEGVVQAQQAQEQAQKAQLETARPSGYQPESLDAAIQNKNVPLDEIADALGPEYAAFAQKTREKLGKRKL